MVSPINIRQLSSGLVVTNDDGSTNYFVKAGNTMWIPGANSGTTPPPTPGGNDSLQLVPSPPSSVSGTTTDGDVYNLNATQVLRAYQSIQEAITINGMTRDALVVMLITELDESTLRNLSNVAHYPETATYPDIDGDGDDSDSVGLFQQRPSVPWGTPLQCCTIPYEVDAFFGGPSGPNHAAGTPQGLFDLSPAWTTYATPGAAAEAVQGSAFADPYDRFVPVANAILAALLVSGSTNNGGAQLAYPFSLNDITSGYGPRINPVTGQQESVHDGVDFGEAYRTPIHAAADGVVSSVPAFQPSGYGNVCYIQHSQFASHVVTTFYGHQDTTPLVSQGDTVHYGDIIGYVDSTGLSTGNHLHFGTWDGATIGQSTNPLTLMAKYGAITAEKAGWE